MIKICEKIGKEFDLTFNAIKTVCIYFPGKRRYRENPPTLYMNDKALSWVKSVKHLGNIVTWDLREVEEISKKRCDFIGRTNSLLANFKSIQKEILSRVFSSQCCHMYTVSVRSGVFRHNRDSVGTRGLYRHKTSLLA